MKSFDQQVADWARTKPAGEEYPYQNTNNCALCQFLKESGIAEQPIVGGWTIWLHNGQPNVRMSERLENALVAEPRTFSALADRLSSC